MGAARSVAWILKSENKAIHSRVMSKWADNVENEARRLLETTNRLRVTEVHGKYEHLEAGIERKTAYVPVEEHERADRRAGTLAPMGVPETRTREAGIPSLWLVSADWPRETIDLPPLGRYQRWRRRSG